MQRRKRMMNRYRINQKTYSEEGFLRPRKIITYRDNLIFIEKQPHKKGGWCRWSEVKDLMTQNEQLKKQRNKMSSIISQYKAQYGELNE